MTITRKSIRQTASTWMDLAIVGTSTGGSAKALLAAVHPFQDTAGSDLEWLGWWMLKLPGAANEETRRVSAITRLDGSLVHGGKDWTNDPGTDEFELHKYNPVMWNRAITLTLGKCFYVDREFIPSVADRTEYNLSGYTWITDERRIKNLYLVKGDTLNELWYEPWAAAGSRWWGTSRNASGNIVLEISPRSPTSSTTTLNGALNDSATTVTVVSTGAFDSEGYYAVEDEIIFYTAKTSTTFTGCTRGALGTTAATHSDATSVRTIEILALEGVRPYADLTTDAGTTTCPDELVIWGARYHMAELLGLIRAGKGQQQGESTPAWAMLAMREYTRLVAAYAPQVDGPKFQWARPYSGPRPLF